MNSTGKTRKFKADILCQNQTEEKTIYQQYWSLERSPFENSNDVFFFYYSSKHKEALARLQYAIAQRKLGVILTGENGVGKTFVAKVLMQLFFDGECEFAYLPNPRLSPTEFLSELCYQLGAQENCDADASKNSLLHSLQNRLKYYHEQKRHIVILVDEAQSIVNDDLFEEMRLLLNLHQDESITFTMIIAGQPDLLKKINCLPSLAQRLAIHYELLPLNREETEQYIVHRLKVTGAKKIIFSSDAYDKIFEISGGRPRTINNVCDFALLAGFIKKVQTIDSGIVEHVSRELRDTSPREQHPNHYEEQ